MEQLKSGMRLEIQHPVTALEVWIVKIIENVGGRLYLRFEGLETGSHDFWLFYLNHRLHPIGWAKSHGYRYSPPSGKSWGIARCSLAYMCKRYIAFVKSATC